jgi:ubiquinone/menaquinone biosynthesis C-methylase UbiE
MAFNNILDQLAAWSLSRTAKRIDLAFREKKVALFSGASGVILELGAGTGVNARYFPKSAKIIFSEPNPYLRQHFQDQTVEVKEFTGERILLDDCSVDVVISSFVLCSVRNMQAVLAEVVRVLRPGGTFRFIEHVGAKCGTSLRFTQDALQPLCSLLDGGCHPNRDISTVIQHCGLLVRQMDHYTQNIGIPLARDFIAGIAEKPHSQI